MLRLPARRIATGRVRMHEPPGGANPVGQIRLKEDGRSSEETRVEMRRKACKDINREDTDLSVSLAVKPAGLGV